MILKVKEKFILRGRGDVWTLSLKENSLSNKRSDLKKLLGTKVEIEGKEVTIKGYEAMGIWDDEVKDMVGILV